MMTGCSRSIYTIWLREFKTFMREQVRIVAMVAQPLLYLADSRQRHHVRDEAQRAPAKSTTSSSCIRA